MSTYTDKDRERSQKNTTLLEQSMKQNDERHADIKEILKIHETKISDNEKKIVDNEKSMIKVMTIYSVVAIPVVSALAAFGKKFLG